MYLALLPGSIVVVALDVVPAWGEWMGAALLVAQGLAVICWMLGAYGPRGALAVAGALLLAWAVEHVGETTGVPFGRYRYTDVLQPQIAGVVPVPITLAWLMSAFGSWQLAHVAIGGGAGTRHGDPRVIALTGLLIVALDLQIETVATSINGYWTWIDAGPYYGVPVANFVAWGVVGMLMALIVSLALGGGRSATGGAGTAGGALQPPVRRLSLVVGYIPALLYILSSAMFTAVNFARGYPLAGLVGAATLTAIAAFAFQLVSRGGGARSAEAAR